MAIKLFRPGFENEPYLPPYAYFVCPSSVSFLIANW